MKNNFSKGNYKGKADCSFPIWKFSREIPESWKTIGIALVAVFQHYILYREQQLDEFVRQCKVVGFCFNKERELWDYECLTK